MNSYLVEYFDESSQFGNFLRTEEHNFSDFRYKSTIFSNIRRLLSWVKRVFWIALFTKDHLVFVVREKRKGGSKQVEKGYYKGFIL